MSCPQRGNDSVDALVSKRWQYILLGYLPPDYAKVGTRLAVEYFGDRYPVTVAVVGSTPLFDPENTRMKQ